MRVQVRSGASQIESSVDLPHHVIFGNGIAKMNS